MGGRCSNVEIFETLNEFGYNVALNRSNVGHLFCKRALRLILKLIDLRALKYGWEIVPSERFILLFSKEELYVGKRRGTLFRAHMM